MSRLKKLLQEFCQDGVEWRTLSDISLNVSSGGTPTANRKEFYDNGDIPWLRTQEVRFKEILDADVYITQAALDNSSAKWIPANCVIVAISGATAGRSAINKIPLTTNQHCCNLEIDPSKALYKYVFYWVSNEYDSIKSLGQGARSDLNAGIIKAYPIPIPPLPIQQEIVRILDTFTALEAELEAELEARKKQYEYYCNHLLTFGDGVVYRYIGDLCDVSRGRVMSKDYLRENAGVYPVYSSQTANNGVFGFINSFDYDYESITWTTDGANAGSVFYHIDEKFSITNVCGLLRVSSSSITTRYLFYCLQRMAKAYVSSGMGNPKLMSHAMSKIKIPVPSLPEQERIVAILDRFDALVNDITQGLPAEIVARRKQYEHYRDKLLTFERKDAAV